MTSRESEDLPEQRFRRLADAAPVLIWVEDEHGNCTWFNRPWLNFTGRSMAEETGVGWMRGVHPDDLERIRAIFAMHMQRRTPYSTDYRLLRHDGEYRWIQDNGTPLFDGPGGAFSGFVGSCVDITDHVLRSEELATSYRRIRELAQRVENVREAERHALAQRLHEGIAQELTGLRLYTEKLQNRLQAQPELLTSLAEVNAIAAQAMREVRAITDDLRPTALEHSGLAEAIDHYARQFAVRTGLDVRCQVTPDLPPLDRLTSIVLFRVMQEALTNAAKHSGAHCVEIGLDAVAHRVRLTVRDDGRGIESGDRCKPGSLGLLGLSERLAPLDGTLEIHGAPETGTSLVAEVPIPRDARSRRSDRSGAPAAAGRRRAAPSSG